MVFDEAPLPFKFSHLLVIKYLESFLPLNNHLSTISFLEESLAESKFYESLGLPVPERTIPGWQFSSTVFTRHSLLCFHFLAIFHESECRMNDNNDNNDIWVLGMIKKKTALHIKRISGNPCQQEVQILDGTAHLLRRVLSM